MFCPTIQQACDRDTCDEEYCNRGDMGETLYEPHPGFHWAEGWFFKRLPDGSVRVRKHHHHRGPETRPVVEIIIPAAEWASIVCSVSALSETFDRWNQAQDFHGRL